MIDAFSHDAFNHNPSNHVAADHGTGKRWLSIIGIGEDGAAALSPVARGLIGAAELVVGGKRHLALAQSFIRGRSLPWPSPITEGIDEIVSYRGRPVAVLASGDPFHYGIGRQLAAEVPPGEFVCLPQPSAFSLAAARMGWAIQDCALVSLHGRALEGIVRHLHPGARILALSWDGTTPAKLAGLLAARGMGQSRLTVLEALGGSEERARSALAAGFDIGEVAALNTIALEVAAGAGMRLVPFACGLDDALFESDGQLTKREIRAVTLSALAPRHGELLWDIGLGAGSVAIEWLLCHPSLRAIGIERDEARADRALRNAAALGVPDLQVVKGAAPAAFAGLPPPDVIFIGGGGSSEALFTAAWAALKPGGRLVANVVTLEGEAQVGRRFGRLGGDLVRLEVSRADGLGRMYGWRPAMPVTQWRVVKS
jgi:precorrin-6B C5,15-methyltransferase / cobalt-precorrin-6B C5,C15-methyltransferase